MRKYLFFPLFSAWILPLCADSPAESPKQPDPVVKNPLREPRGLITPPVEPRTEEGFGIFVDGSFTWWRSEVSGTEFAEINSRAESPPSGFQPGFKAGFGIDPDFDGWDLYGRYTWFRQKTDPKTIASEDVPGISSFLHVNTSTGDVSSMILTEVTSRRKERFNIFDAELGRDFFISRKLTLRPHIGGKWALMTEKTFINQLQEGGGGFLQLNLSQKLSGIGIRAGWNTLWHVTKSLGLYGDVAVSALASSIHNYCNSYFLIDGIQTDRPVYQNRQTVLPIVELGVGFSYANRFFSNRCLLYVKAGWEEQIWIGYNYNIPIGTLNNTGNLTLQGFTGTLGFVF